MHLIVFIHSSVGGHLGCFPVMAIVNSAVKNIGVHVSFQIMVFSGYLPTSGIVGLWSSSIFNEIFFGHTHSMQKFLLQGSNLLHNSDSIHCSDNAGYLTLCTIEELLYLVF